MLTVGVRRAVDAAVQDVAKHRPAVFLRYFPIGGNGKFNFQVMPCDAEDGNGEAFNLYRRTLLGQPRPVDAFPVFLRPHPDVANLPDAEAAVDKILVGVKQEVEEVIVGIHRNDGFAVWCGLGFLRNRLKGEKLPQFAQLVPLKQISMSSMYSPLAFRQPISP